MVRNVITPAPKDKRSHVLFCIAGYRRAECDIHAGLPDRLCVNLRFTQLTELSCTTVVVHAPAALFAEGSMEFSVGPQIQTMMEHPPAIRTGPRRSPPYSNRVSRSQTAGRAG